MVITFRLFIWLLSYLALGETSAPAAIPVHSQSEKSFSDPAVTIDNQGRPVENTNAADALQITYKGKGFYPVEMDGFGVERYVHYPVRPRLPYVSPDLPAYYRLNGSPLAYLAGSVPEVMLKGKLALPLTGEGIITGRSANLAFKEKVSMNDGSFSAELKSKKPVPDFVDCWKDEEIRWQLEFGNKRYDLGITRNTIYTILSSPTMALVHTALNISAVAGRGLTDTVEITKRVYQLFQGRAVRRVWDDQLLSYYKLYEDKAPAELRGLLMAGSGQCVSWSYLLYAALDAQGISSEIIGVMPPGKGRLYVKNWKFIEGDLFIHSGKNGVCETKAADSDVQIIEMGNGQPYTPVWKASPVVFDSFSGDDKPVFAVGPNGLVDTKINDSLATPAIPFGFGLPNQRAYVIQPAEAVKDVKLEGDDIIVRHITNYYVLTGANGILETGMQKVFATGKDGKPHPYVSWHPKVGQGANHINFQYAIQRVEPFADAGGDDIKYDWWLSSGRNGVSETPGCNMGKGKSYSVSVGAGKDGVLNSKPAGDDSLIDLRQYMRNAPAGYKYIYPFNMWPEPGVFSQNNETPPPDFPNHVIVKVGDKYYDPSYGTGPFTSQLEWEKASISGVGIRIEDKDKNFVRFDNRILFYVKPVQDSSTITAFMKMLPPS